MIKKILSYKIFFYTLLIMSVLLFTFSSSKAGKLDDFKAPNYIYLEQTAFSGNLGEDLQKLLKNRIAFLFVSGCYLDKKALPGFYKVVKKYRDVKFIRISQFAAKDFMLKRYASFGAPKVYLMINGDIASYQSQYFQRIGKKYKSAGWEKSIVMWADEVYPIIKEAAKYKNITPLTSYNYMDKMSGKKMILYRGSSRSGSFKTNMKILFKLASKYPGYNFGFTTGIIPYNQEFDYKFIRLSNAFSIVTDGEKINAAKKVNYRRPPSFNVIEKWMADHLNADPLDFKIAKKGNYLRQMILSYRIRDLAVMNSDEFIMQNKKYNVVKKLYPMQSFYVMLNAATLKNRNIKTAKIMLDELKYKSKGGVSKVFRSRIMREKIYLTVIKRKIKFEKNSVIKKELLKLEKIYSM